MESEGGFREGASFFGGNLAAARDYAREGHFEEGDVETDSACHEDIVVFAFYGAEGTVGALFVGQELGEGAFVAFDV